MNRKLLYALPLPLIILLLFLYFLNEFSKQDNKTQFEKITIAQGMTIGKLFQVVGAHLIEKREEELQGFLNNLYKNQEIIYIGLFKNHNLTYLISRFEGYFPVGKGHEKLEVIDSPIGKIFNITSDFFSPQGKNYSLAIGFNYGFLKTMEISASRNFILVAGIYALLIVLMAGIIMSFNRKFLRKELELKLEKQEKDRFKEMSLLTAEIAHEIKNPLNSIYLSFNSLEKVLDIKGKARFYGDSIKSEVKRLNTIINSYSGLSKEIKPQFEDIDLMKFYEELRLFMEEELKKNYCQLKFSLDVSRQFRTDRNLLKHILFNLIKNSMEADAQNILLAIKKNRRGISILLKDDGKGMNKETAANVFKPYTSSKAKGMGLGLYIVKKMVDTLSGNIRLISNESGNTVFSITLPEERKT